MTYRVVCYRFSSITILKSVLNSTFTGPFYAEFNDEQKAVRTRSAIMDH